MTNHTEGYSGVQMALHWGIAVLIGVNYLFAEGMEQIFDASMETGAPVTGWVAPVHVYVGLTVFVLALIRLALRLGRGVPAEIDTGNRLLNLGGRLSHYALYLLMIAVPALGATAWFGEVDTAAGLHVLVMNVMMILILLHSLAAIYHQFILRDGLLTRMLRAR